MTVWTELHPPVPSISYDDSVTVCGHTLNWLAQHGARPDDLERAVTWVQRHREDAGRLAQELHLCDGEERACLDRLYRLVRA